MAALNGVWTMQVKPDPDIVAGLLDRVAGTGLPHCLQLRPGSSPVLAGLAAMRGMRPDGDHPLMVMENPEMLGRAQRASGLKIRQLDPEDAELHVKVAAAGFAAREEPFRQLITPDVLRVPGVRCYLGENAQPVATGIGVTTGTSVGVFNIATVPASRGLGYGTAITARVITDGLAAGAAWSWLQASPAGHALYTRLEFRSAVSLQVWLSVS